MPFEARRKPARRIAVVGGGISGMGAAYHLSKNHHIVLFEKEPRLGGHARTIVAGKNRDQPVDTGFIVFNYQTYPHLTRLFAALDVPVVESDMSFGVSARGGSLEYGLASVDAIFSQRRNLVRPAFLRMVRDILRFSKNAEAAMEPGMTIGNLIAKMNMGDWFRDHYLTPFSGAIWSTPTEKMMNFPADAMIRFFRNHGILDWTENHQWFTVKGGSIEYVQRLESAMDRRGVDIRVSASPKAVRRTPFGVEVRCAGGEWEAFDDVVFATHSDTTLSLLSDASETERSALGAVRYQANRAVLHADPQVMPKSRKVWSSWSYVDTGKAPDQPIDLTYWMNSLQQIPQDDPMFVTLNRDAPIRDDLIYDEAVFHHPVYDLAALAAQDTIRKINGRNRTWFCGAWMKNGFHEDGLASAMDVVEAIETETAATVAAE